MTKKDKIISSILTILLSVFVCIPIFSFKKEVNEKPEELYRVYLYGKSIGTIKSREKLEKYINEDQKELKEKYNVETVYAPKNLYISKVQSYDGISSKEKDVYEIIKGKENFTIKGYVITIEGSNDEDDTIFNVLDKTHFENAITSVVKAFVPSDELEVFLSGEEVVIKGTGSKIEDLYIKENIKIKEAFIPSNEHIFINEKDITKYLLFGNNIKEKYYTVKAGDTIESIANANKLAVEELLVVNQGLKSKNNILSIGEEVSVALISPIITVVEEEHSVEEKVVTYQTIIEYDSTMMWGDTKIKQEGKNGLQIVTQKLKKENGEIVNALIAGTEVVEEAINGIKVVGTMSNNVVINPEDIPDSGDWYWPTKTPHIITSPYGWRWGTLHDGTDISGTGHGSPIYAANNGVVTKVWYDGIGGNQIILAHSGDIYTWYAHMASTNVKLGQTITRGQKIGTMGCTGSACTGTHLHFASYLGRPGAGGKSFNAMTLYR